MARKTLSQRISFDGAEEMQAAVESIAAAWGGLSKSMADGAKAFQGPGKQLSDRVVRLKKDFEGLRAAGKRLGDMFRTTVRRGREFGAWLVRIGRRLAVATAGALAFAAAIIAVARSGAKAADAAAKSAAGLNLTIEQYTALKFAATQSGLKVEQFETALNSLNTKVADAAKVSQKLNNQLGLHPEQWAEAQRAMATHGTLLDKTTESGGRAVQALRALGVEVRADGLQFTDTNQTIEEFAAGLKTTRVEARPTLDILFDLADAFQRFPDGIQEAGLAAALFGEDLGRRMLPFLNQGSAGLRALMGEAERVGATFTTEQGKIGTALIDAQGRLGASLKALKDQIGLLFAPALTDAADRQTEALIRHRKAILDLTSGLVPRAVALVEDLVNALAGRDQDVREPFILEARDAIIAFARDVRTAFVAVILPAFQGLLKIFDQLAVAVNEAFGTDFSGRTLLIAAAVAQVIGVFSSLGAVVLAVSALVVGALPGALALLEDLVAAIQGRDADVRAQWALDARDAIVAFVKDVSGAFTSILFPLFKQLLAAADFVAEKINAVFGTDLTGMQLLLAGLVAKWLGLFRLVASVLVITVTLVSLIGTTIALIAGAAKIAVFIGLLVGWPALLVAALVLAAAAIVLFWDEIVVGAKAAWDAIGAGAEAVADFMVSAFRGAVDTIVGLLKRLINFARRAFKAAKSALGLGGGGSPAPAPVPVLAGGGQARGLVRGPGTSTSDSILARLSDSEFVVQAKAVAHYGVAFMRAINARRLPKGALPGFSLGGLVDGINHSLMALAPVPAYADGGVALADAAGGAPAGRSVTLVLDGQRFGLTAEDDVAEALVTTALRQQRRSGGKMPPWYGG